MPERDTVPDLPGFVIPLPDVAGRRFAVLYAAVEASSTGLSTDLDLMSTLVDTFCPELSRSEGVFQFVTLVSLVEEREAVREDYARSNVEPAGIDPVEVVRLADEDIMSALSALVPEGQPIVEREGGETVAAAYAAARAWFSDSLPVERTPW